MGTTWKKSAWTRSRAERPQVEVKKTKRPKGNEKREAHRWSKKRRGETLPNPGEQKDVSRRGKGEGRTLKTFQKNAEQENRAEIRERVKKQACKNASSGTQQKRHPRIK